MNYQYYKNNTKIYPNITAKKKYFRESREISISIKANNILSINESNDISI